MKTITIKKENEERIFRQAINEVIFSVNGKQLRVNFIETTDELGDDYEVNVEDIKTLTEEEYEVFQDCNIWDLGRQKVGKILKVDGWE